MIKKTRYYIQDKEVLILRKHIEACFSQDLSPFHFDFLTSIYEKINSNSLSKFFISEKQYQVLHHILVTYVLEGMDESLGIFFKKEEK